MASRRPTYQGEGNVATGAALVHASEAAFNSGGLDPNSVNSLLNGIDSVSSALEHRQKQDEAIWVDNTTTKAQLDWEKQLQERKLNAGPGAPGFAGTIQEDYQKFMKKALDQAPSRTSSIALQNQLNNLGSSINRDALHFETSERVAQRVNEVDKGMDMAMALSAMHPEQRDELSKRYEDQVRGLVGIVLPSDLAKLKEKSFAIKIAGLETIADTDGNKAVEELQKYAGQIPGPQFVQLLNKYKGQAERMSALEKYELGKKVDDHVAMIQEEGHGLPGFSTGIIKDPVFRDKAQREEEKAYATSYLISDFKNKSSNDILKDLQMNRDILRQYGANSGKTEIDKSSDFGKKFDAALSMGGADGKSKLTYTDQLEVIQNAQKVLKKELDLRDSDPAAAADKNAPEVQKAVEIASKNQDPKLSPGLLQDIVAKRMAYQEHIGIPVYKQEVITKSEAMNHAAQIGHQDVNKVQEYFASLSEQYGPHYSGVMRAMQNLKPEEGQLDPRFELVGLNIGQPFTNLLIESIKQKPEVLNSVLGDDKAKSELVKAIHTNPVAQNLLTSMSATTAGRAEYYSNLMRGTESFAKVLMMQGKANNPADAGKQAVQMLFGRVYDFGKQNGKTYAINRFGADGRERDPESLSRVKENLDGWLDFYANQKPENFNISQFEGIDPVIRDQAKMNLLSSNLNRKGFWSTTPDNRGVELWVDADGKGSVVRVLDKDSHPIVHYFDKLADQKILKKEDRRPDSAFIPN